MTWLAWRQFRVNAAFWGAPLVAHELEAGTHRLAWTQSVTRRRWLATKLAVTGLAAVIVTGVFSLVFSWWSFPFDRVGNRIGTANFGQRGITPIAYAVFALVLGTLAGAVLRRTLAAMAATLVGFIAVRFSFQLFARRHILDPVTTSLPTNLFGQRVGGFNSDGGWILATRTVDATGHTVVANRLVDELPLRLGAEPTAAVRGDECDTDLLVADTLSIRNPNHWNSPTASRSDCNRIRSAWSASLTGRTHTSLAIRPSVSCRSRVRPAHSRRPRVLGQPARTLDPWAPHGDAGLARPRGRGRRRSVRLFGLLFGAATVSRDRLAVGTVVLDARVSCVDSAAVGVQTLRCSGRVRC
jgi:ABC-2 family transporter protein